MIDVTIYRTNDGSLQLINGSKVKSLMYHEAQVSDDNNLENMVALGRLKVIKGVADWSIAGESVRSMRIARVSGGLAYEADAPCSDWVGIFANDAIINKSVLTPKTKLAVVRVSEKDIPINTEIVAAPGGTAAAYNASAHSLMSSVQGAATGDFDNSVWPTAGDYAIINTSVDAEADRATDITLYFINGDDEFDSEVITTDADDSSVDVTGLKLIKKLVAVTVGTGGIAGTLNITDSDGNTCKALTAPSAGDYGIILTDDSDDALGQRVKLTAANAITGSVVVLGTDGGDGEYARGTITITGLPTADQTMTIGAQTFTWKASGTSTGNVVIGATAAACATNLVTSITRDLTTVTAEVIGTGIVLVTAASYGAAGNSIAFADVNSSNVTFNGSGYLGATTLGADSVQTEIVSFAAATTGYTTKAFKTVVALLIGNDNYATNTWSVQVDANTIDQIVGITQEVGTAQTGVLIDIATTADYIYFQQGGKDIKGSSVTNSENADTTSAPTNIATIAAASTVAAGAWAHGTVTQPDRARNIGIAILNDSAGALDLFEGVMSFTITGTFKGLTQTDIITFTSTSENKEIAIGSGTAKYRVKYGVKPFDTVTDITLDNEPEDGLKISACPGSLMGIYNPIMSEKDIIKITVSAANRSITGNLSTTNNTVNIGAVSDNADFEVAYRMQLPV